MKAPKKKKKKSSESLLARFLKKKKGKATEKDRSSTRAKAGRKKAATSADDTQSQSPPPTPRQRSIEEIKQMKQLGDKSPERLAGLLSTLLSKERDKTQADREQFDQMVWSIIQRHEQESNGQGQDEEPPAE